MALADGRPGLMWGWVVWYQQWGRVVWGLLDVGLGGVGPGVELGGVLSE